MTLWPRRILLVLVSLLAGFILTYSVVYSDYDIFGLHLTLGTTFTSYGIPKTVVTVLSMAVATGVWLDKLFDTQLIER